MKWKKWAAPILLLALIAGLWFGAQSLAEQQTLSEQVVRLHVIAASDEAEDQQRKLLVRDAVLQTLDGKLTAQTPEEAVQQLSALLPELGKQSQAALARNGESEDVQLRLCRESYPTRDYGTFALPAGEYVSLQVRIGKAEGHNWWCVVYPNLCSAAEGRCWEAATVGLGERSKALLRADTTGIKIRFRFLELFQNLKKII